MKEILVLVMMTTAKKARIVKRINLDPINNMKFKKQ